MKKFWKISNNCDQPIKLVVHTGPTSSLGLALKPNQFVIAMPKQTPSMDVQLRRKRGAKALITVEKEFDNFLYEFKLGTAYDETELEKKKLEQSEAKAAEYVKKG